MDEYIVRFYMKSNPNKVAVCGKYRNFEFHDWLDSIRTFATLKEVSAKQMIYESVTMLFVIERIDGSDLPREVLPEEY